MSEAMVDEAGPPLQEAARDLQAVVTDLFEVHDVTVGIAGQPETIRLQGRLLASSEQAYPKIADRFMKLDYTALLRRDADVNLDVLLAMPGALPSEGESKLWLNALLYALTILSTLFVGVIASGQVPPDTDLLWLVSHLWLGWPFALSLMIILTGHELGHYFAARHYKIPVSLPYFIPLPISYLGTMGAFIVMKGRSVNRRQMLTIGAAGPLVGFALTVPILLLGLSLSEVLPMEAPAPWSQLSFEGNSIFYLLLKLAVFGQILPGSGAVPNIGTALGEAWVALIGTFPFDSGYDVFIHPVAFAGWAGLLVTALNLLPVGQLDGGHVVYSLIGQQAKVLTWPVIGFLLVLGIFVWKYWLLWVAIVFLFGQYHPDPLDDVTRLDMRRVLVAVAVLLIFILTFSPLPMREIKGEALAAELADAAFCLTLPALIVGLTVRSARWMRARQGSGLSSALHRKRPGA
jgi:Zn-dependent protease